MAIALAPIFRKAYYSLALFGGLYLIFVFALTFPTIQRIALYAHLVNPAIWENVSDVEAYGFLQHQIQPFTLVTPDNETLYAWHILPLHLAEEHSAKLIGQGNFKVQSSADVLDTVAFKLLASDPNAHVVVNFHGNAGHLASSYRPFTYQRLLGLSSKTRPVHVIAFDYRGFGLSTGTPSEEGLITDAETMLSFLTSSHPTPQSSATQYQPALSIPPVNIILTSQSLGTAVATALLHRWTLTHNLPPPQSLILTSPFCSLPSLIDSYSIKGIIPPLLSPFRSYTWIMNKITAYIADTWLTDRRLGELLTSEHDIPVNIELLHAKDDREIPWWETQRLWDAIMQTVKSKGDRLAQERGQGGDLAGKAEGSHVQTWAGERIGAKYEKKVRFTRTQHGGHNRLACSEEVAAAVWRALESDWGEDQEESKVSGPGTLS
jgi:pimeloyl-ACP methyl ester carboxylesterase